MNIEFIAVELTKITDAITQNLTNLSSPVDTFCEGHIEEASHYQIIINDVEAGYTSIHDGNMVTQFVLADSFKKYGQPIFQQVKKMEKVQRAFVPTSDGFFLAHALDEYKTLEMQAYFFQSDRNYIAVDKKDGFSFRQADMTDADFIQQSSGDFFDPVQQRIAQDELFIAERDDTCVGFGIAVRSKFCPNKIDIGMYTNEDFRNKGVGTAMIRFLRDKFQTDGCHVVAGCWYYNHYSKRTLEKAGMYTQTRLLKVGY